MKKYTIIIWPILVIVALMFGYFSIRDNSQKRRLIQAAIDDGGQKEINVEELEFSQEDLESYYAIYDDPYVKYLRAALNEYSSGKITTVDEFAIKKSTDDSMTYGLDSFDANYYKSKFIVLNLNNHILGGKTIDVIFTDNPDRVFVAWIYPAGESEDLQLREFYQNSEFDSGKMAKIKIQFKRFLTDKEHSI